MECPAKRDLAGVDPSPNDQVREGAAHAGQSTPGPAEPVSFDADTDPLTFLSNLIRDYGDTVRYTTKFGPCFLFVHPAAVETVLHRENYSRASLAKIMLGEGLLTSEGHRWKSQRRLMQNDFARPRIASFAGLINRRTKQTEDDWRSAANAADEVDITAAMTRLTLKVIGEALFSDDLQDELASQLCDAISRSLDVLGRISWTVFGIPVSFTPNSTAVFTAARQVLDSTCFEMIARRRALQPADRPRDLLTLMIEDENAEDPTANQRLRDQIVTMIVSGHETTALALSWTWKLLAENPHVEVQLHQEIDAALNGRTPELADVPKLAYASAVFQESMRLYPPVWNIARVASESDMVQGHQVPRGARVLVSPWFTHRHEAFWPRPEVFDPTRFIEPAGPGHRYAYFPFGGGRHQCLGIHLAQLEGTLVLSHLAQRFRIRPIAGQVIRPDQGVTLRQKPHLRATLEPRSMTTSASARAKIVSEAI
jgi:cytochrome P450